MVTNDPSNTKEAFGTIELGNYNLNRGTGMVNAPLTENTALRIAFTHYDRDSFMTNGGGKQNNASGLIKYLYKPSDNFRLLVGAEFSKEQPSWQITTDAFGLG